MALPILETASYELTLPSTDVVVKYRPFIVKEEKILLQALESQNQKQIVQALKDIVSTCTFGQLNVDELPTFDLEYVFLLIRSKSVGEIGKLKVLIDEDKKIGVLMRYPTINSIDPTKNYAKGADSKTLFDVISKGIYQIQEGENVHLASDYSKEEMDKFVESIPSKAFKDIQKFYETMPQLKHVVEVENPKTKVKSNITLTGLSDFFG